MRRWRRTLARYWVAVAASLTASQLAQAQMPAGGDSNSASPFGMEINDDRVYLHALFDELEGRLGSAVTPFRWDGEAWIGTDTHRLWVKSEGFAVNGTVEDGDQELLYDHPISTYFDVQAGVRYDLDSLAGRGWGAVGIEGLAPYFFELSATLYASDAGHYAGKLMATYDELLTQRLIFQPLVELNVYTRPDLVREVGAGLSDLDAGLRLRYEITRKLAPYVAVICQRTYGPRAPVGALDTGHAGAWRFALGLRAWF